MERTLPLAISAIDGGTKRQRLHSRGQIAHHFMSVTLQAGLRWALLALDAIQYYTRDCRPSVYS